MNQRGQTLQKSGASVKLDDAYQFYPKTEGVTVGQAAEKYGVIVKSLYSKISRDGDKIAVEAVASDSQVEVLSSINDTMSVAPSPSLADVNSIVVIPSTAVDDIDNADTVFATSSEDTEEARVREDGDETINSTYEEAEKTSDATPPTVGPPLPPGEPMVDLYEEQAVVH